MKNFISKFGSYIDFELIEKEGECCSAYKLGAWLALNDGDVI
jgi:hypothetical protein